jgi:hypothetical protein
MTAPELKGHRDLPDGREYVRIVVSLAVFTSGFSREIACA